jgi:hypothetical protein
VGQATPPASARVTPPLEAGLHNPAPIAAPEVRAAGNGRRPFAPAVDGVEQAPAPRVAAPFTITLEAALYALMLLAAVLTRFWNLGSRALHHDESLHAYFSWLLATGQGYTHDPLMHGPFLFHMNALVYALLG